MEDDEYEIPLRDQRYFGAGIKRKRVQFVPPTSNEATVQSLPTTPSLSAADAYLSIVFKDSTRAERSTSAPPTESKQRVQKTDNDGTNTTNSEALNSDNAICDICHRAVTSTDSTARHESSIAHQICLQHSYPPNHIDRRRKGLAVLESQGWDPDGRRGLGAEGEGRLHPIRAKENPKKAGLGMKLKDLEVEVVDRPSTLDAGTVRKKELESKKKAERLRSAFYGSEDMEKYLGAEGETNGSLDLAAFKRARRRRG